jgi:hypothetical protein
VLDHLHPGLVISIRRILPKLLLFEFYGITPDSVVSSFVHPNVQELPLSQITEGEHYLRLIGHYILNGFRVETERNTVDGLTVIPEQKQLRAAA